jgi:hypothetical protein
MEATYKNDALLQLTKGSAYLFDASVTRFDIYLEVYQLYIDVYFILADPRFKAKKQLKIHFRDIIRYQFLYCNNYYFYNVESCKFFKSDDGYHMSLDPFDESEKISEEDEDIILCKNIEGNFM